MRELLLSNVIKNSSNVLSKYVAQLERPNVGNERESECKKLAMVNIAQSS